MGISTLKTLGEVALGSIVGGLLSIFVVAWVLKGLPTDYFRVADKKRAKNWLLQNVLGWLLIVIGIVLSVPGIPGQGLLTVLAGVILADFPKKMELERWLMRKGPVFRAANAIRRRFHKPPFDAPEPVTAHAATTRAQN